MDENNEDLPYITEDMHCSACGAELDIELMHQYDYQVERSGTTPGTVHYPTIYWCEGSIACPGCGVRLPYDESSD